MANQTKLTLKSITWAAYNTLVTNNTLDNSTLYFINDRGQIYTHGKLYGGKYEFYSTLPQYPELNTLYISNTDLSTKIWDGTNWHDVSKGYTVTIGSSSTDALIPTAKAVYDFVTAYTPGGGGGVSSISWDATDEELDYEIGGTPHSVPLTGLAHDPSYDSTTRTLSIPVIGGNTVSVQLEDCVVTAGKYNSATKEIWLSIADDGSYTDPDKVIKIPVSGLVDIYTVNDTDSIDLAMDANNEITASARISSKSGNILTIEHTSGEEGLYVPDPSSAIAAKASKVASNHTGEIIVADVNGDNALSNTTIGGATLDPSPSASKVATEAAVSAHGQSILSAANTYADALVEWVNW